VDFRLLRHEHFNVDHCHDCMLPGYLIISSAIPIPSLTALSKEAQRDLGPILAAATATINKVIAPIKVYCALFGEEHQHVHFHLFPRTAGTTAEFLCAFPEQRNQIHGPVLFGPGRSIVRQMKTSGDWHRPLSPRYEASLPRCPSHSLMACEICLN